jgi:hypothetical protein
VHASPELCIDLTKLRGEPLSHGDAADLELAVAVHPTEVGEAEEVEGLRFPPPVEPSRVPPRKAAEANEFPTGGADSAE